MGSLGRLAPSARGFETLLRTQRLGRLVLTHLPGAEHMDFIISIKISPGVSGHSSLFRGLNRPV